MDSDDDEDHVSECDSEEVDEQKPKLLQPESAASCVSLGESTKRKATTDGDELSPVQTRSSKRISRITTTEMEAMQKSMDEMLANRATDAKIMAAMRQENAMLMKTIADMQGAGGGGGSSNSGDGFMPMRRPARKTALGTQSKSSVPITTANSFSGLPMDEERSVTNTTARTSASVGATTTATRAVNVPPPKPAKQASNYVPPVYAMANTRGVLEALKKKNDLASNIESFALAKVSGGRVSIKAKTRAHREQVLAALSEAEVGHFSFAPKEERNFKSVLFGMDDFTESEVEDALNEAAIEVRPVSVKRLTRYNKEKQETVNTPFFLVCWPPTTRMSQLKDVRALYQVRCGFRSYYPSKRPPQCGKCQTWGHIRAQCFMPARCRKCARGHESSECTYITDQSKKEDLKCCNCEEKGHPANWTGCAIAIAYFAALEAGRARQARLAGGRPQGQNQKQQQQQPLPQRQQQQQQPSSSGRAKYSREVVFGQSVAPPVQGAWTRPGQQQQQQSDQLADIMNILKTLSEEVKDCVRMVSRVAYSLSNGRSDEEIQRILAGY